MTKYFGIILCLSLFQFSAWSSGQAFKDYIKVEKKGEDRITFTRCFGDEKLVCYQLGGGEHHLSQINELNKELEKKHDPIRKTLLVIGAVTTVSVAVGVTFWTLPYTVGGMKAGQALAVGFGVSPVALVAAAKQYYKNKKPKTIKGLSLEGMIEKEAMDLYVAELELLLYSLPRV